MILIIALVLMALAFVGFFLFPLLSKSGDGMFDFDDFGEVRRRRKMQNNVVPFSRRHGDLRVFETKRAAPFFASRKQQLKREFMV